MKILSIETSCDETALAFLDAEYFNNSPKIKVINTALYSQIEKHREYGGVYPSLAKREHAHNLVPLLTSLLNEDGSENSATENEAQLSPEQNEKISTIKEMMSREPEMFEDFLKIVTKMQKPEVDMIAVTSGPGLEPALWVGINFAKALSLFWNIPMMPINHMEGHITSVLTEFNLSSEKEVAFPAVALLISGGHTELVLVKNWGSYEILGSTKDDAAGEALDKVARLLGLPYPGGPEISKLAAEIRNADNSNEEVFSLPRPMLHSKDFDFSFSGLKTAVLYLVKKLKVEKKLSEDEQLDIETTKQIALEFENAITEVLFKKTSAAINKVGAKTLIIGGGVIGNKHIRDTFLQMEKDGIKILLPEQGLSTDNAVMIGIVGFLKSIYANESEKATINPEIKADGGLKLS